jgi:cephalosporin hydroxylase
LYQELLYKLKPDVIIETGTRFGGSALFVASICDLIGKGRVFTIDIDTQPKRPQHDRITYISGSSIDPEIVAVASEACQGAETVFVLLDSDHTRDHVYAELKAYANLVTVNSFIIVEDSNINGNPVLPNFGPGPMEALIDFLSQDNRFVIDPCNEKLLLSFSPRGFLRRTA